MPGILEKRLSEAKQKEGAGKPQQDPGKTALPAEPAVYTQEPIETGMSQEDADFMSEIDGLLSEHQDLEYTKKQSRIRKFSQFILSFGCLYLIILIYGTVITEFEYGDNGEVEPVVLSIQEIGEKAEFGDLLGGYLQTRALYEKLLTLDYRMASGMEDSLRIAPEYEAALDDVSALTVQIDAMPVNSRYNQVKNMLLTIVQTHMAVYCQFMSSAITQNDANAGLEAIACREQLNASFQQVTANIITLGSEIPGMDMGGIEEWSPDGYVLKTIEGIERFT